MRKWHPDENLLKEDVSTIPVWVKLHGVPVTAFSEDDLSAIATKLGTPLVLDSYTADMCMQSWGRSSYARVMIELRADVELAMIDLRADVELKDNIVVDMPKITREGYYVLEVFGHVLEEFPKNIGAGATKNLKKTSQTPKGIPVGQKMGFKPKTGKLRFMNDDGNPIVPTGIVDSDSEVEVVFDETANLRLSTSGKDGSDKGYSTNSLLEQWRDSYPDNDNYDSYDDDMYENHDLSEHLQSICDDLDNTVRGGKKK
ncbi:copia protein [Tanacetum coccineum]